MVQKLEAEVESRRLRVRKDKMVHADLGKSSLIPGLFLFEKGILGQGGGKVGTLIFSYI